MFDKMMRRRKTVVTHDTIPNALCFLTGMQKACFRQKLSARAARPSAFSRGRCVKRQAIRNKMRNAETNQKDKISQALNRYGSRVKNTIMRAK